MSIEYGEGDKSTDGTLTTADAHDLLSNPYRRAVLDVLASHGEMLRGHLAECVARRMGEPPQRVETILYHCHLPKLEDYGCVDQHNAHVAPGEQAPVVRRWASCSETMRPR